VLVGSRVAVIGSGRYARCLSEQLRGAVELVPLDAESVARAVGRERLTGLWIDGELGKKRLKLDALVFDGPGAPSFELAVQAGASVDFSAPSGYWPRSEPDGRVADRVFFVADGADAEVAVLAALERALNRGSLR